MEECCESIQDYTKLDISKLNECLSKLIDARADLEASEKNFYDEQKQIGGYVIEGNRLAKNEFSNSKDSLTKAIGNLTYVIGIAGQQFEEQQKASYKAGKI